MPVSVLVRILNRCRSLQNHVHNKSCIIKELYVKYVKYDKYTRHSHFQLFEEVCCQTQWILFQIQIQKSQTQMFHTGTVKTWKLVASKPLVYDINVHHNMQNMFNMKNIKPHCFSSTFTVYNNGSRWQVCISFSYHRQQSCCIPSWSANKRSKVEWCQSRRLLQYGWAKLWLQFTPS